MISITLQSFNDKGIMTLVQKLLGNGIADREQKSSYSVPANKFYDKVVKNVNITRIGMSKMVLGNSFSTFKRTDLIPIPYLTQKLIQKDQRIYHKTYTLTLPKEKM